MAIVHYLIIGHFILTSVLLIIFIRHSFKRYYISIAATILIFLAALESSALNAPYSSGLIKQRSYDYLKEFNSMYPITTQAQIPPPFSGVSSTVEKMALFKTSDNNNATILQNGANTYTAIFNELEGAKNHIHIEDFIIRDDVIGKKFQDILIKKASEGVKVRLIVDSLGFKLKGSSIRKLKKAGIQLVRRNTILKSVFRGDFNYRDHRKIYIVDGKTAFTGGINVGKEYVGMNPKIGNWRDTDIMLTGDSVKQLQGLFLSSWYACTGQKLLDPVYYPQSKGDGFETIQIGAGYPVKENPIEYIYLNLITSAQKSIFIETPYLTLDETIFDALSSASLKGVSISIIIPSKPDEKMAYSSTLQYADRLAAFGVKIYKYPAFIHSKLVIIDGSVASLGTVNLNNRSMHLDFENTSLLYGGGVLDSLNNDFRIDLSKSKPFTPGESKPKGIKDYFYFGLSRILNSSI